MPDHGPRIRRALTLRCPECGGRGLFFISMQVFQMLDTANILTPALAAWLPILFFGPLSWVLFDAVQT